MFSPTAIAAYLAFFTALGILFLLVNLLVGYLVRPHAPNQEKLEIYECGEPTIGSSFVQFDLRFYVVALLFIIFDVEVALFFPWAVVYGKVTNLSDPTLPKVAAQLDANLPADRLTPATLGIYRELGVENPVVPAVSAAVAERLGPEASQASLNAAMIESSANQLALLSLADIGAFFAVLLVGFAYVWKRGDLDWVRAVSQERSGQVDRAPPLAEPEVVLSA
jgi:NADH-quinone oxidoreductase subunit A